MTLWINHQTYTLYAWGGDTLGGVEPKSFWPEWL